MTMATDINGKPMVMTLAKRRAQKGRYGDKANAGTRSRF